MVETKKTIKKIDKKTPKKRDLTDSKKKKVIKKKVIKKKEVKKVDKVKKEVKKESKKEVKKVISRPSKQSSPKYFSAIGGRKTSRARIRLFTQGDKDIKVNEKPFDVYFVTSDLESLSK